MRRFSISTSALALLLAIGAALPEAAAADLAKLDHTVARLPEFTSKSPEYCLLVFGPDAKTRVWLVRDGDVLYVDRNGNGDLTEADERIAANAKESKPDDDVFYFEAGDIPDGALVHKDLTVSRRKLDHVQDQDPDLRKRLERVPRFRGCFIDVEVAMPGFKGTGIDGRVVQLTSYADVDGFLEFAARPADAPVIHFGGPWQITLWGRHEWEAGRETETILGFGTPGVGPGSTAFVGYEGIIPAGIAPTLEVTFPPANAGQKPITKSYELTHRCCTVNLYGDVDVPKDVEAGKARVAISIESWPGAFVAPTTHDVEILPAKPAPKLEPVSARLKGKLEHVHPGDRKSSIDGIQFSPDGKRLVAGDYPGGIVHVWDMATGKRLVTIETGEGLRGSTAYFAISPDWKTLYAPQETRAKIERFVRDGQKSFRVTYDGGVRVFDLDTGEVVHKWKDAPPRSIRGLDLTPNGRYFVTLDEVPGEFESSRPHALSLWDAATGSHRQVAGDGADCHAYSPDSTLAAVTMRGSDDDDRGDSSIALYSVPEWTERCKIPLEGKQVNAYVPAFACQGRVVVGRVTTYPKADGWDDAEDSLRFWDAATAEALFSIEPAEKNEQFFDVKVSPDGRLVAATNWWRKQGAARLYIVDVERRTSKSVELDAQAMALWIAFHPSGRWLAVSTQGGDDNEEDVPRRPQPRIHLVDVARGAVVETLVSPQAWPASLAFSPDGKTLATSGTGAVLLWDFSTPPGSGLDATGKAAVNDPGPIVPDGPPQELLEFIAATKTERPAAASRDALLASMRAQQRTVLVAADKILAAHADRPTETAALAAKLEALWTLAKTGDNAALADALKLAESLRDDDRPALANRARGLLIYDRAQKLARSSANAWPTAEATALADDIKRQLDRGNADSLLLTVAAKFVEDAEAADPPLAGKAAREFAAALAKNDDRRSKRAAQGLETIARRLALVGQPIAIEGGRAGGAPFDWSAYRGKVVLVEFWATWCAPCVAEIPDLKATYDALHDSGFEVVTISLDADRELLAQFINDNRIPWPVLCGRSAAESGMRHPMALRLGIESIPATFLVGRDGKVASTNIRGQQLRQAVDRLLTTDPTTPASAPNR